MRVDLVTLFPQCIAEFADLGVTGDAVRRGLAELRAWNPRDQASTGRPDDRCFGGGPGMLLGAEPLAATLAAARESGADGPVIYLSAAGERFDQGLARELSELPRFTLLCGRYEGIDQRLIDAEVDREISIGDFVLSGGELAALTVLDATLRLLPGVLGDEDSARDESFVDETLEYPHYTRPSTWRGYEVPRVLLSGDHAKIRRWRLKQALGRTWLRRADLIDAMHLDGEALALLREFIDEQAQESENV